MRRPSRRLALVPALALLPVAVALGVVGPVAATVIQRGDVRVDLHAGVSPRKLPRTGAVPVSIAIGVHVTTADGSLPPQLRQLRIEVNRAGRLRSAGLPVCRYRQVQPTSSAGALAACGAALVGRGRLTADVVVPGQSPFPSRGEVLAFNSRYHGRRAILAHVYGTAPYPTSYTLPLVISAGRGRFGTTLTALLPRATGEWGYLTSLSLRLGRTYRYRGRVRAYLSAACPAPPGFPTAAFALARGSFAFAGERPLTSTVSGRCWVRG
jgi:hypothetical protein